MVEQEVGSSFRLESSEFFMKEFPSEKCLNVGNDFFFFFFKGVGFAKHK